jgi:hypothetical protein
LGVNYKKAGGVMIKNKIRTNTIFGIFTIMLLVLMFALPASAIIPIKLKLTANPANIMAGAKSDVNVTLLDENEEPIVAGSDIRVDFSTTLGIVPSSMMIYKGNNSVAIEFTSSVPGIAVISVKSKGLDGDTTSIAVVPNQSITPFATTPALTATPAVTPMAPMISPFVIIGIIVLISLYFRKK